MTDKHEDQLIAEYNAALNALKRCPKGDPRHIPLAAKLIATQRAIKRYRRIKQTRDQNL
jgi:hypothetical protein